jgi:hypothetical protein
MRKPMANINSGRDLREVAKAWGTDARGHADSVTGLYRRLVAGEGALSLTAQSCAADEWLMHCLFFGLKALFEVESEGMYGFTI